MLASLSASVTSFKSTNEQRVSEFLNCLFSLNYLICLNFLLLELLMAVMMVVNVVVMMVDNNFDHDDGHDGPDGPDGDYKTHCQ